MRWVSRESEGADSRREGGKLGAQALRKLKDLGEEWAGDRGRRWGSKADSGEGQAHPGLPRTAEQSASEQAVATEPVLQEPRPQRPDPAQRGRQANGLDFQQMTSVTILAVGLHSPFAQMASNS